MASNSLSSFAFSLGSWANRLPAVWRKRFYQTVKVLSGLATLALLILPQLPGLGINLPPSVQWDALFTALLAFTGHLADRNTEVPVLLDAVPAPEVHPSDAADAA